MPLLSIKFKIIHWKGKTGHAFLCIVSTFTVWILFSCLYLDAQACIKMLLGGQRSSRKGTEPMEGLYPSWVIQRQLRASWTVLNAYRSQFESRLYTGTPCMTNMCLQVGAKHPLPSVDWRESLISSLGQHLHLTLWASPQLLLTLDKTCTDCKHGHPIHTADMISVVWIRSQIPP